MIRTSILLILLLPATFASAEPPITALAVAPEGGAVVTGSQRGLEIREPQTLEVQRARPTRFRNVHEVVFSLDGWRLIVVGGDPGESGGFEIRNWPSCDVLRICDDRDDVLHAAVPIDAAGALAVAGGDQVVALYAGPDERRPVLLAGHSRRILAVAYVPAADLLVSGGADQIVRVWNRTDGTLARNLDNHTAAVNDLAVRPGNAVLPMVASASADRTVRFWQPTIGRLVRFVRFEMAEPLAVAWTNDGSKLLAACTDGRLRVVDPETARLEAVHRAIDGWAYEVIALEDRVAIVGGSDGQLRRVNID